MLGARLRSLALSLAAFLALGLAACDGGGERGEENGRKDTGGGDSTGDTEPAIASWSNDALFAEGRDVFRRCAACHNATARQNKVGPHLVGLFGRQAGAIEDFRYSEAMRQADVVWDEQTLRAYLRDPRGYIPGNRMAFAGIRHEEDLDALIAYLRAVTAPE